MSYGSLVVQMLKDFEDVDEVNKQLERMFVQKKTTTTKN